MTCVDKLPPKDRVALEAASLWWEKLRVDPAQELSSEFVQWISEAQNAKAFSVLQDMMAELNRFGTAPGILDMRRSALSRLRRSIEHPWLSVQVITRIAAILVICAIGVGGYTWYRASVPITYGTLIGQRWLVALPDGSRASLDSDTTIQVQYTGSVRHIELDRGQARFDVAHDTARPFTVAVGTESVRAVGTVFNVDKLGSKTVVTLIQGRVVINDRVGGRHSPVFLAAGQQMSTTPGGIPVVSQAKIQETRAWESNHLIFRNEPLGDAIQRVNRYAPRPITVAPGAASIPISGVFNAGDIDSFISAITSYFPVDATTDPANRIRLERRT